MKIGMCVNAGLDKIEHAAKCGFDYVEYRFEHLAATSDEEFDCLKKCLKENNINCDSVNCFIPGKYKLVGDDIDFTELKEYIEKGMKRGAEIGLKIVVFGSGKARAIPDGTTYEQAFGSVVHFLGDIVAPVAEKYGITVVIEPLKRSETNFINTVKEGAMVAAACNSKNIKVLGDFYHMADMNDSPDNILDLKGSLVHAHVAEPDTRACPQNGSEAIYRGFFSALEEIGCERCSLEATHKDFFAEIAEGLSTLRNV